MCLVDVGRDQEFDHRRKKKDVLKDPTLVILTFQVFGSVITLRAESERFGAVQAVRVDMKENRETGERMRFCLRNSGEN